MTPRELERQILHVLRHHDLARRFQIDSVVQPTDQPEWWIDLIDRTVPVERREVRIVFPKDPDWEQALGVELVRALERIAAGALSDGAARRCPLCGHTAIFGGRPRQSGASVEHKAGDVGAWRCQNQDCDYLEHVSG